MVHIVMDVAYHPFKIDFQKTFLFCLLEDESFPESSVKERGKDCGND